MLAPKRVKFRKRFKGRTKGMATRGNTVAFGHYGLMALEPGWISNRQIEASRVALTREMKRGGKVWIRLFPDKPITKKPAALREMKNEELEQQLAVLTEERFRLGFRRATEALGNPLQLRTIRREIARINTILAERKRA